MPDQDATLDCLVAVLGALRGDAALAALVGDEIHDAAPSGDRDLYVELGSSFGQPELETNDDEGWELVQVIHVWSKEPGRVSISKVCAAITDVLHEAALAIGGRAVVRQRLTSQQIMPDPDGVHMHGVQRFTFWTCP